MALQARDVDVYGRIKAAMEEAETARLVAKAAQADAELEAQRADALQARLDAQVSRVVHKLCGKLKL